MTDPLTASVLVTLAIQEFVKSGTGDLAKRFTAEALAKIPVLWDKIKSRLSGKSEKVNEALGKLEKGDTTALETVAKNLDVVLDEEPNFAEELRVLAKEIQAGKIQDNSNMEQNVTGNNNMNVQAKAEQGGKQYIAEKMYFGAQDPD